MEMATLKISCPNCQKTLRPSYQVCQLGHVVCPQCRLHQDSASGHIVNSKGCYRIIYPLSILNNLFLSITDTCQYGCGIEADVVKLGNHENICKLRNKIVKCALPRCEWTNEITKIIEHVYKKHPHQLFDIHKTGPRILLNFENPIILGVRYPLIDKDNEIYWIKLFKRHSKKYVIVLLQGKIKPQNNQSFDLVRYTISNVNNPKLKKDFVVSYSTTASQSVLNEEFIMENGHPISSLQADNYQFEFKFDALITWENPSKHLESFPCNICNALMQQPTKVCSNDHTICKKCSSFFTTCQKCKFLHKLSSNPFIPWVTPGISVEIYNCTFCKQPVKGSGKICHRKHLICIPCIKLYKITSCRLCKPRAPVSINPIMRRNPTVSTGSHEDQEIEDSFEMVTRNTASWQKRPEYAYCKYKGNGCYVFEAINTLPSHEKICIYKPRPSVSMVPIIGRNPTTTTEQEEDSFVMITAKPKYNHCKYKEDGCCVFETNDKLIPHEKICSFKPVQYLTAPFKKMALYKKQAVTNYCKHKEEGCKYIESIHKLPSHEEICTFKLAPCAKDSCDWRGTYNDITKHWKDSHKEWRQDNGSSFRDSCFTYLIPCGGKNFILTWASNDNIVYYLSVHHMTPEKTTDFFFKVELFNPRTMATVEFSGPCIASTGDQVRDHGYRLSAGSAYKFTRSMGTTMNPLPSNRHILTIKITKGCVKY